MNFKYNPSSPEFQRDPYSSYEHMREHCPVYVSKNGFVVLTRYDDVATTLRNPKMSVQYTDYAEGGAAEYLSRVKEIQKKNPLIGNWRTMLRVDDPLHEKLKKFALPLFSNANVLKIAKDIEKIVETNIGIAMSKGSADIVSEVTLKTAQDTVCYLVAVPDEDREQICSWADSLTMVFEPIQSSTEGIDNVEKLLPEVINYLHSQVQERIKNPRPNDIVTSLLYDSIDGHKLEYIDVIGMMAMMFVAGIETATYFMANSINTLLTTPSAKYQLFEIINEIKQTNDNPYTNPKLNNAVEELLRYNGSVWQTSRVNTEEVSYDNNGDTVVIPKGSMITVSIASANRDPRVFSEPNTVDLYRENARKNIGFSAGAHYCLGANIAKVQTSALLMSLFGRFPDINLLEEATWRNRYTFRGVESLMVSGS